MASFQTGRRRHRPGNDLFEPGMIVGDGPD
jgi:hypothetical protein